MATTTPTILLVCTGNVCRSPAAQFLLAKHLGQTSSYYSVLSAGTSALVGEGIDPTIRQLLHRRGIGVDRFAAQALNVDMLRSADLILTASTNHRAAVVKMMPSAVRKTFTLKQLARYAPFILESGDVPASAADRISWILSAVPHARSRARPDNDSLADPIGQSRRRYDTAVAALDHACALIAGLLGQPAELTQAASPSWWEEVSVIQDDLPDVAAAGARSPIDGHVSVAPPTAWGA